MKKVVRTVWISALSGLAFLAACCSTKGLSKAEKKQLVMERDSIQGILAAREGAAVYGSPEVIANYALNTYRLRSQLDSINAKLGEDVDLEKSARRVALQERIAELQAALQRREGACVYGSPEIIEEYGRETQRMRDEVKALRNELRDLDKDEEEALRKELREIRKEEIEALPVKKPEGRAADVLYGSPDPNRK
ncbi:MAG: hypothetical protein IKD78_02540 [Bacteroidales bacterium]|nr:hypothetical protein [Bacteroidales bacterium]MBR6928647.1 hypothetical protein [Bacteroidales bacterium]